MNHSTNNPAPRVKSVLRALCIGTLANVCLIGGALAQTTTVFAPARDNTLYERPMGDVSNGAGTGLFFGQTGGNAGNALRRALMFFDLSSIPPGSTILNADLTITVDTVPPGATGFDAALHRVTSDWGEGASAAGGTGGSGAPAQTGDATWVHTFFDTGTWTTIGGDFMPAPSATTAIGSATGSFTFASSPELVADIQAWVDSPAANFGWMLLGEETNPQNARRIPSRENGADMPSLSVTFMPAGPMPGPDPVSVPTLNTAGLILLLLGIMLISIVSLSRKTAKQTQ